MLCQNSFFGTASFRYVRMREVQCAKIEAEERVLEYVTEAECHKERSNLRMMTNCLCLVVDMILFTNVVYSIRFEFISCRKVLP